MAYRLPLIASCVLAFAACDNPTSPDAGSALDLAVPMDANTGMAGVDGAPPRDLAAAPDQALGLAALNDEFNDPATLKDWTDLYPARHDVLDINNSAAGQLTAIPVAMNYNTWYSDNVGVYLYKTVTGDFVVETAVRVGRRSDPT